MILVYASLIHAAQATSLREWWTDFCEKHLVAEDPWQYRGLTEDELVDLYFEFKRQNFQSRALVDEIRFRLQFNLSDETREILSKTIAGEK